MSVADVYADLLAQARANLLPLPAEPFPVNSFMHVGDPNKAVVFAYERQDTALLDSLAAWWKQTQAEPEAGQDEQGLALF